MPKTVAEYRCLIISPGDVDEERGAIADVLQRWNASVGMSMAIRVEPVRWETHVHPDLSGTPQAVINQQVVGDCDFGVAVFWTRLGTPTDEHQSGSVEEIERLLKDGKRVMLYRCLRAVPQDRLKDEEFKRLRSACDAFEKRGLLASYSEIAELREKVNKDLTLLLARNPAAGESSAASTAVETIPRPDIRVTTAVAMTDDRHRGFVSVLTINVENHSPRPLYLASFRLLLKDQKTLFLQRDCLTGALNAAKTIDGGDSASFHVDPEIVLDNSDVAASEVVCAQVYDKIGRIYASDAETMRKTILALQSQRERAASRGP